MLLTIHNLPPNMRYADVKSLIYSKCAVKDVILDNLVNDGHNKKVTVGLAEEEDAAMLIRQINGLVVEGNQLYVEDVRKKKASEHQFRQTHNYYDSSKNDTPRSNNQPSHYQSQTKYSQPTDYQQEHYSNQMPDYQSQDFGRHPPVNQQKAMNTGDMYMPQQQNSYMDYSEPSQPYPSSDDQYSLFPVPREEPLSRSDPFTPKEHEWSRERPSASASQQDSYYGHSNKTTHKSDPKKWGRSPKSRPRSRSPSNKRQGFRDRSGISPKRARNEYTNVDTAKISSRDSQRYPRNREETYTSQSYSSRDHNQGYTSQTDSGNGYQNKPHYRNDSFASPLAKSQSQAYTNLPAQNLWNARPNNPPIQNEKEDVFAGSVPFEGQVNTWECMDPSSTDLQSNYRKHMEMKAVQQKNVGRNPEQTWGRQNPTSDGSDIRSKCTWWNANPGKNETTTSSRPGLSRAPEPDKHLPEKYPEVPSLLKITPLLQKNWERSSFDKPPPVNNTPKADSNSTNYWSVKPNINKGKQKKSIMPMISQDSTFRFQAADQIATEMKNAHPDIMKEEFLMYLRQSVRSRLEVLLSERLGESLPQMIGIYRNKFPKNKDREFCKLVVKKLPANLRETMGLTGPKKSKGNKKPVPELRVPMVPAAARQTQPASNQGQPTVGKNNIGSYQPVPNQSTLPPMNLPNDKLPKYPNANKAIYKEQRKIKKLEHQNEDMYTLSPHLQQALEEELQIITDVVVKLNVTKRLLNITTNLIVRVYATGKPPKKHEVEEFFRKQNVVSMKKSDRKKIIYVATCNNFATYDRLCNMGSTALNNETMLRIKPFQLVGPKLSCKERNELRVQRAREFRETATNAFTEKNHEVNTEENKEWIAVESNKAQDQYEGEGADNYDVANNDGGANNDKGTDINYICTDKDKRADNDDGADDYEVADNGNGADGFEVAGNNYEGTDDYKVTDNNEGADDYECADNDEGADEYEIAEDYEGADDYEIADNEGAVNKLEENVFWKDEDFEDY